jgi:hypothetical protein
MDVNGRDLGVPAWSPHLLVGGFDRIDVPARPEEVRSTSLGHDAARSEVG